MIEPVYVPYEQYRAAKTRCELDSRIYGMCSYFLYMLTAALDYKMRRHYTTSSSMQP
jgi:hypothetical protein